MSGDTGNGIIIGLLIALGMVFYAKATKPPRSFRSHERIVPVLEVTARGDSAMRDTVFIYNEPKQSNNEH